MQVIENDLEQVGVLGMADAAKIGDSADVPEKLNGPPVARPRRDLSDLRESLERPQIIGLARDSLEFFGLGFCEVGKAARACRARRR